MALQKLTFKPGINRERSRYANEGGWYDCDKIRFRQGLPEKIGGWQQFSKADYLGVCRSLFSWVTLNSITLWGAGTHLKFYIYKGALPNDITPIRSTSSLGSDPVATTSGSAEVTITDTGHGASVGDYVTLSGLTGPVGGVPASDLNQEHSITSITDADNYVITVATTATSSATGGGASGQAEYQVPVGFEVPRPVSGWGVGPWGSGTWGTGSTSTVAPLRLWHQANFGEDLLFNYRGGDIFFWDATNGVTTRGVFLSSESGASDVPEVLNQVLVSDNRFVFALGSNPIGSSALDPLLIRWSDQEDAVNWTPAATNQAGSLRLSRGSEIVTGTQARQEVLVWTDSSLYSLQYLGAPEVWGQQIVGDNISIMSPNSAKFANNVTFWMGRDKFYRYDGTVQTLRCDVLRYVFDDLNMDQRLQVFSGLNEEFGEVWWFYCSSGSTTVDKYVVYNYEQDVWYYGSLARSAWFSPSNSEYPVAATYGNKLVQHEFGLDDRADLAAVAPIEAFVQSAEFDIDDGDKQMLIRAIYPDLVFEGSTSANPNVTLSLFPRAESGSAYNSPLSESGNSSGTTTRTATTPVEVYTDRIDVRVRGKQISMKVSSDSEGVQWQLGAPRIEARPSGRR